MAIEDEAVTGFAPARPAVAGGAPSHLSASSPSVTRSSAGRFIPGTLLAGRYRILGLLGRGGMGEVYRAGPDLAGTPAYMAPEQFLGKPASVQSDLYALGLVLYEIFTGKPAVSGRTVAELARQHREQQPSSMTAIISELDPAIERTIQRCLEKDPTNRPPSALSVSAGLPGGDPLAAAIARGETPSPELVASAGEVGFLRPLVAIGLVALVLAGLVAITLVFDQVQVTRLTPMPRPPEVLRDRRARRWPRSGTGTRHPPRPPGSPIRPSCSRCWSRTPTSVTASDRGGPPR